MINIEKVNLKKIIISNFDKSIINFLLNINGLSFYSIKKLQCSMGYSKNYKFHFEKNQVKDDFQIFHDFILFFYESQKNKIIKNIDRYKKIKNYKGIRHSLHLPVRGQRTHTNAKSAKKYFKSEI